MGIEPTSTAWEAAALPLSYTRTEGKPIGETHVSPAGDIAFPFGVEWLRTYLAISHLPEVCTLSRRGDHFIPYAAHYRLPFAFSDILCPLWYRQTLRPALSSGQVPDAVPAAARLIRWTP